MSDYNYQKSLMVSIIGIPNAGKSTLLNYLVGQKISIVTHKPQTTRSSITGILTENDTQIVFIDTPGIFNPKKQLEKAIVRCAWSSIVGADLIIIIIDLSQKIDDKIYFIINKIITQKLNFIIVLNKVDLLGYQYSAQKFEHFTESNKIFAISAKDGHGIKKLKKYLISNTQQKPWLYDKSEITNVSMRFLAQEITREQLFLELYDELPYNVTVETEKWETCKDNSIKIYQAIIINKANYKNMIIGKAGKKIKHISQKARLAIIEALNLQVHLFLFVKVNPNWEATINLNQNI